VCVKISQEPRGWIGANQHEEFVRCVAPHGEFILDLVLCIMHDYRCTEDILFYRFSCKVTIYGGLFSQGGWPVNLQEIILPAFCIY
jgi:hypothetical protein